MLFRPSFRWRLASLLCNLARRALVSPFTSSSATALEDTCSAPIRFGESGEEEACQDWRRGGVCVEGLRCSEDGRTGMESALVLGLEASHRLAQEGRFKEMRLALNQMVREEGLGSAQVLCDILLHNFAEWDSTTIVWDVLASIYAKLELVHDSLYIMSKMDSLNMQASISTYDSLLHSLKRTPLASDLFHVMKSRGISPSRDSYDVLIQSLCKQNNPLEAMSLFHEARDAGKFNPCIITFTALTSALCNAGFLTTAKSLWSLIFKYGLVLDKYSYSTLIHGLCKANLMKEAMDLLKTMKHEGLQLDIITYNSLISRYRLLGLFSEIPKVVEMMESEGVQPDIVTYTILISIHCEKGNLKEGLRMKQEILCRGFQLNVVTYSVLLNALFKIGDFKEVDTLLREIEAIGLNLDVIAYSILVKGYCELGDVEKALEVCEDMYTKNSMPNSFTYSSIISGLCKKGMMAEARWLLENLATELKVRDIILYNIVIDGYTKVGDIDSAVRLYEQMVDSGLEPTIVTINSLIYGFCKVGNLDLAERLFNEIGNIEYLRPTVVTYTILMDAFCLRNVNKMLSLFDEMLANLIRPNEISVSVLIKGFCKEGRFGEVIDRLLQLQREGLDIDSINYNILIQGYCKKRKWDMACHMHDFMLNKPIWTPVTSNVLINELCLCGMVSHAERVLNNLLRSGVYLRKFAYMTIIRCWSAKKRPRKALLLFERMLKSGFNCSIVDFCSVINRMCKRGSVNEALALFNIMLRVGVSPDKELFATLYGALRRDSDLLSLIMLETLILKSGINLTDGDLKGLNMR
ncbi:Pentatricopeptide repeat (PPR) superfamily protein [Rhynchospora pubera]|uniref:Pentatricopeptide repeat (PPR) superfamily protein n=1 Tax=Rhynchospora pubera TaxID=906938 RepID=A0AAV8GIN1_9POAL|nr:Pentatricopeptide repeat (PPR) superfamily protein [Rhynchospora pubera]